MEANITEQKSAAEENPCKYLLEYTRLGNVVLVECYTEEQRRILNGVCRTEEEKALHKELVKDRFRVFETVKRRIPDWDFPKIGG